MNRRIAQPELLEPTLAHDFHALQIVDHEQSVGAMVRPMRESLQGCRILLRIHVIEIVAVPRPFALQESFHVVKSTFNSQGRDQCEFDSLVFGTGEAGNKTGQNN